jgi:hypothetical protein
MSLHNIVGPGTYDGKVQKSLLLTFPSSTHHDGIFWYTGRLEYGGRLLRNKIHAHNNLFHSALFFAASPRDLGITAEQGFSRQLPHIPVNPKHVGLENIETAQQYFLNKLHESQVAFDMEMRSANGDTGPEHRDCGYPNAACKAARPALICQSFTALENIDGFAFDRRQPTCCTNWTWDTGQTFTVVGFTRHSGFPVGPHMPLLRDLPDALPGHVGYWLSYDASSPSSSAETDAHLRQQVDSSSEVVLGESFWGTSVYNRYCGGSLENPRVMLGYQRLAMYMNGYSSTHWTDWRKVPNGALALVLQFFISHLFLILTLIVGLQCWCCVSMWRKLSTKSKFGRHKKCDELSCETDSVSSNVRHLFGISSSSSIGNGDINWLDSGKEFGIAMNSINSTVTASSNTIGSSSNTTTAARKSVQVRSDYETDMLLYDDNSTESTKLLDRANNVMRNLYDDI